MSEIMAGRQILPLARFRPSISASLPNRVLSPRQTGQSLTPDRKAQERGGLEEEEAKACTAGEGRRPAAEQAGRPRGQGYRSGLRWENASMRALRKRMRSRASCSL